MNLNYIYILNKDVEESTNIIDARIPKFSEHKIPENKKHMYPSVHWVWDSLKYLLPKLCAVINLSFHVVNFKELVYRSQTESILKSSSTFFREDLDGNDVGGNYLIFDSKRKISI